METTLVPRDPTVGGGTAVGAIVDSMEMTLVLPSDLDEPSEPAMGGCRVVGAIVDIMESRLSLPSDCPSGESIAMDESATDRAPDTTEK
jgi:hypothetical protein